MRFLIPLLAAALLVGCAHQAATNQRVGRIPVILDTDIGNDIDDTYALVMLLRSPQFDVRLISTTDGQPEYRARLVARLLTIAGRTDIPIAMGPAAGKPTGEEREARWLGGFKLDDYPGTVLRDAPAAIARTIRSSTTPVTVIAIGPLQTLAETVEREPGIVSKANLVGMQGSVFKGYGGSPKPAVEFNVKLSVRSAQRVLSAPWRSVAITPLDTCGLPGVSLDGERFAALKDSSDPLSHAIVDAYAAWDHNADPAKLTKSTVLFDTVAIYLAGPNHSRLKVQTEPIRVTDQGMTVIDPNHGRPMAVATDWTDLPGYRDQLLHTLLGNGQAVPRYPNP